MVRKEQSSSRSIAYSYIRLSSRQQILGDGQRRQLEAATEYCRNNNLTLSSKSFRDLGVAAIKEVDRPSLSDLHECINRGVIVAGDVIILEKLDRLSRQGIAKTQAMLQDILNKGVIVVSLLDGLRLDKDSLNDLSLVIRIAIAADLANKESAAKSVRIQANKDEVKEKIRKGIPVTRRLPFWLSFEDGKYVFNARKEILDRIIELRQQGTSYIKIAGILNSEGVPSINKGSSWGTSAIRDIIRNPILYGAHQITAKVNGEYQPLELIQDYYPAAISYSLFKELNGQSVVRPAGHSETNPLSGLVYCGLCGYKMVNKGRTKKNGDKVSYYYCRKAIAKACTHTANVRDLFSMTIDKISHLTMKKPTKNVDIDKLRSELLQVENRIRELTAELSNVNSALPITAIIASVKTLEDKKAELNVAIENSVEVSQESLDNITTNIKDPKKFNMDLKKVIKRIEITPENGHHRIMIERHDGHFVRWRTGQIINTLTDTEKMGNMVKGMLEGVEEE